MRVISWLVVAVGGFALMAWSYFGYQRIDETTPWACGLIYVAAPEGEVQDKAIEFERFITQVRLLPSGKVGEALFESGPAAAQFRKQNLGVHLREKLILMSPDAAGIGQELLAEGRLPTPGRDEVIAGFQASCKDQIAVSGRALKVVGVLRRDAALWADSYLIPSHDSLDGLFNLSDPSVRSAVIIRLTPQQFHDRQFRQRLAKTYPRKRFAVVTSAVRADRGPYYLYLAGQALLLLGGSGFLIGMYKVLEQRSRWRTLHEPLAELNSHPRLLWTIHLCYFGLALVAALIVYELPDVQTFLLQLVGEQMADRRGLLGIVAEAYLSGNVPLAMLVTFLVNFFIGSIAYITVPSLVIPGVGALPAAFRALLWGLLLAPTVNVMSLRMLPHSWTLLLEGEAYILATFLGLLVPMYLFRQGTGEGVLRRYGRALVMNFKGNLLVAIVLLVAACYEAIEVILMTR